jgi:hypothetical protein
MKIKASKTKELMTKMLIYVISSYASILGKTGIA